MTNEEKTQSRRPSNRLERMSSTWTQATDTSIATAEAQQPSYNRNPSWLSRLNPLKRNAPPVPVDRTPAPEYRAGFWSKLTFQWISPLMAVGYQRPLELRDVWAVNPDRRLDVLSPRLRDKYARRKAGASKRPLIMALYDTFRTEFLIGAACQFTASLMQIMSPFLMKYLIAFAARAYLASRSGAAAPPIANGIGLVLGITAMQVVQSFCTNHFIYRGMTVGGQARSVLIAAIFDKALKISGRARAGGSPAKEAEEKRPEGLLPGSREEKAFFARRLKQSQVAAKMQEDDGAGWSNGRIVNLMAVDTYRVDQASGLFHLTWNAPIQVMLTLVLLLINLGYSALAGFAFICIMMPALGKAVQTLMRRRRVINKITDQRVTLTQEIMASVRFVKYFGWEMAFLDRLRRIRDGEISKIAFLLSIRNAIMAVGMTVPIFASMLAFITYSLTSHVLNPAPIFSSLALFNALRIPLNLLPTVIGQVVDGAASLTRIQQFLEEEEVTSDFEWDLEARNAISVRHADFTWERNTTPDSTNWNEQASKSKVKEKKEKKPAEEEKRTNHVPPSPTTTSSLAVEEEQPFQLRDINLEVGRGELIAVIGSVGAGKSSLLEALAGQMRCTAGSVTLGSHRAYCPQYAWIQNATFRENVIFGKAYDRSWYNRVVDACALRPDLQMLPSGDETEIGERGITVSGGQKARLNIARAIYFDADLILMDDPLSAVDAHVGKHMMDQAICGLLRDKCRVLATHQLHVLHRADRIVWMKQGAIYRVATFAELMAGDEEFQGLMEATSMQEGAKTDVVDQDAAESLQKPRRKKRKSAALMSQEDKAVNSVGWSVYAAYLRAAGSLWVAPLLMALLALSQGANIITSVWLSWWTSDRFDYPTGAYIAGYACLGLAQAAMLFIFSVTLTVLGTRASKVMSHHAITRVLRSPMAFFDTTPLGRITNRFAKDVDVMDNQLTEAVRMFAFTMGLIVSVFCLIIAFYYYFAIALVPLAVVFLFSAGYYRASARELKRHEALLRSVVFSRFGEGVTGLSTISAYGLQQVFGRALAEALDSMDGAYFLTYANQRWLAVRLDAVGSLLVFTTGILVVTSRFSVNPSIGGLVLSYILTVVQMIQFAVRQLAEIENNMNSTERIHEYGALEQEAPLHLGPVPDTWPSAGAIDFSNVHMRYRPGLPLVLTGLTMHIPAGERIGIVGRTGAGKSSILSTLFRLVELADGAIAIDGIDIARVGLHDLRSRLAIIPQDPTLFRGSIRSNLDPFARHPDPALWRALQHTGLADGPAPASSPADPVRIHLDAPVEDEGLNFSLGQRQLLALARALVNDARILVCDEATSAVDFDTDRRIQQVILDRFRGRTLLCIAHRLHTILRYDRILVLDAGAVAELDAPLALYDRRGLFRAMCDSSGISRADFFDGPELSPEAVPPSSASSSSSPSPAEPASPRER